MAGEAKAKKEEGNTHFKEGRYEEALACYTKVTSSLYSFPENKLL